MIYASQTFRLEADDQVLTLWLDFRGRTSHTFSLPILHELNLILDRVAVLPMPEVFLIRSSRPGIFLEEFDSAELARFKSPLEFAALARRGQEAGRKIASFNCPTVALIEGRCAGAGLELALACDRRWLIATPETRFDFPDADRGLVPCWGGTYRLPKLVGVTKAIQLFRDRKVGPMAAHKIGLVDELISPAEAPIRLLTLVDEIRGNKPRPSVQRIVRRVVARLLSPLIVRPTVTEHSDPDSSPETELRVAIAAGLSSEGEGLAAERAAFTRLATSAAGRQRLELHRRTGLVERTFAEPASSLTRPPRRIGIVGGGDLGSQLAVRLNGLGHEVFIQEENPAGIEQAVRRVRDLLATLSRGHSIGAADVRRIANEIRVTAEWVGFDNADLVIEVANEDPGVKRNVFHELERRVRPRVPLLSGSTTIPVETIQAEMNRPGRIAGLHLPNPSAQKPVAELVGTNLTDSAMITAMSQWARQWGFVPIRVADRPGRLVEHVQLAYLSEGVALVAEGLPIGQIDADCRQFGMGQGPLEWCDAIGLDRLAELTAQMQLARGDGFARNLLFQRLTAHGCLGREVGEGFYRYGIVRRPSHIARMLVWQDLDEDAQAPYIFDPEEALREGIERIVLRTVNEAAAALVDEPDSDPASVDVALAFGMDWAPARGGPLRYADSLGLSNVVERLASFAERFGPRYRPCDELVRRAEAGETFYGETTPDVAVPAPAWRMAG